MINNRTLAIAAVLALTVPAVGAAAPVYFNPLTEQLVEGHTVFAVLEVVDKTTREKNHFAAAVAVLVRENIQVRELQRFPGVLWFNDQYLVNPWDTDKKKEDVRYPCGGAVLAVNAGSPDPRVIIGPGTDAHILTGATTETVTVGNVTESAGPYGNDYAWLGNVDGYVDVGNGTATYGGYSDAPTGALNYIESYLITDPNDHMWQIDVYEGNSRLDLDGAGISAEAAPYKVWAVNVLGSPVFVPDLGDSCPPVIDAVTTTLRTAEGLLPCTQQVVPDAGYNTFPNQGVRQGRPGTPYPYPNYHDDPCNGYQSPSDNNYCYNGVGNGGQCDVGDALPTEPVRLYNALLYFKLEHLTQAGAPRSHADGSTDTNGCQVGTEWECPTLNDDDEGNSHPFHPDDSGTTVKEMGSCPETFYVEGGERSNHGGSTTADSDVWYDGEARYNGRGYCDELHATRNIDLYFSGEGRPFPPVRPNFAITDLEGSAAPFHCHTLEDENVDAPITNPDCAEAYYDTTG